MSSDIMFQNFLPTYLDDDLEDEHSYEGGNSGSSSQSGSDSGSLGSPTSYSAFNQVFRSKKPEPDYYSQFNDYLGLSKLLQNVKITEENPLLYQQSQILQPSQTDRLPLHNKVRRQSWESDGSDPSTVVSPSLENYNYDFTSDLNGNYNRDRSTSEPGFKQLPPPPPSWRLPKAMRDHIISGAYQQQFNHRGPVPPAPEAKFCPPPPEAKFCPPPPQQQQIMSPQKMEPPTPPTTMQGMLPARNASCNQQQQQTQNSGGMLCCVFCRNNKESEKVYTSHNLKDAEGRTVCPILRAYTCPICKANGDNSHTIKYCPENQNARFMNLGGQQQQNSQQPPSIGVFRPPPPPTQQQQRMQHSNRQMTAHPPPPHPMNFNLPPQGPKIR